MHTDSRCLRRCPKCTPHTELVADTLEMPGVLGYLKIDRCSICHGVWLDWSELGDMYELEMKQCLSAHGAAWQNDLLNGCCPACEAEIELARLPFGAFAIERCPRCLGLWFDGGELQACLSPTGFKQILRLLGRVTQPT